ncbi:unannotated protein [freshwater metagenome]|uniref:Unannotated protein n=1 Tax=freshwater metagenome TaxID=449393 RepID=A0A6J7F3Y4_9ZZZZ
MFGVRPGGSGSRITEIASRRLLYRPRHGSVRTVRLHVGSLDHDIVERTRIGSALAVVPQETDRRTGPAARWSGTHHRDVPTDDVRSGSDHRHRHLLRALARRSRSRSSRGPVVPGRRNCRRARRYLLRRNGLGGAGVGIDVLLRIRDDGGGGRDGCCGLPAAGVRGVECRGGGRLERIPQRTSRQSLRLHHPARVVRGTG